MFDVSPKRLTRIGAPRALFCCVVLVTGFCSALSQAQTAPPPRPQPHVAAPVERRAPLANPQPSQNKGPGQSGPPLVSLGHPAQTQQHLTQWMESHRNLTLQQQQSALEAEPGFRQQTPQNQQHMHDRLTQLNNMPRQQQQQILAHTEAMERLAPPQRQQIRSAMQQLGALPEDRRRAVARSFRALRDMPESQRQAYLNSPALRSQFSEGERGTLDNLMKVAPMLPPPPAAPQR